jgi:hypothetical protein
MRSAGAGEPPCDRPDATALELRVERALQRLAGVRGVWVATLPELSLLRVRGSGDGPRDAFYALVRNAAHTNVASLFREDARREPEKDTLTVVRGPLGSYPNFNFEVEVSDIDAFVRALLAVQDAAHLEALVSRWGVRRTSPRFWATCDWIHEYSRRRNPTEAGLFDLGRYTNL